MCSPDPSTSFVADWTTTPLGLILRILNPIMVHESHSFRQKVERPIPVRLLLPDSIRPHGSMGRTILSRAKVIAKSRGTSSQRGKLLRIESTGHARVSWNMIRPLGATGTIGHTLSLVGTESNVNVWACVAEDIFQATPCCAVLPIFWPDERFRCLHVAQFSAFLVPATFQARHSRVLSRLMSVGLLDRLEESV